MFCEAMSAGDGMTRSMTGYGKASSELNGESIAVELSSVNHRYLDSSLRLPPSWMGLDPIIKQTLRKHIARGKLTVSISRRQSPRCWREMDFMCVSQMEPHRLP